MPLSRRTAWSMAWLATMALWLAPTGDRIAATAADNVVPVLSIDGPIGPAAADYVGRGIAKAGRVNAPLVVLRLDTPGGLDSSMREIIREILAAPMPVATYVGPPGARAASAGTYILYASHIAAMSPGTNLGAATPVQIGGGGLPPGGDKEDEAKEKTKDGERGRPRNAMEAKITNDAVAYIRSLAELRGRNADWAEKAVREAASLSANDARKENVVDIVARDLADLLRQIDGRRVAVGASEIPLATAGLRIASWEPDWRTELLAAITNPNLALILLMIGVYGLIFEFMNPGALYPGTIGAICLLIGLYALSALPTNYAGLALLALGIALLAGEALTPSFGVLGVGGAVALAIGAALLVDTDVPGMSISWPVILAMTSLSIAFVLLVVRMALKTRKLGPAVGREHMLGGLAKVQDWNGLAGHVLAQGERWNAVSSAPLAAGQRARIVGLDGLTLRIEPEDSAGR